MMSGIRFNGRRTTFTIPDLAGLPIFEGKVNVLVENVFLISIDIKEIGVIWTGQIAVEFRYTK